MIRLRRLLTETLTYECPKCHQTIHGEWIGHSGRRGALQHADVMKCEKCGATWFFGRKTGKPVLISKFQPAVKEADGEHSPETGWGEWRTKRAQPHADGI